MAPFNSYDRPVIAYSPFLFPTFCLFFGHGWCLHSYSSHVAGLLYSVVNIRGRTRTCRPWSGKGHGSSTSLANVVTIVFFPRDARHKTQPMLSYALSVCLSVRLPLSCRPILSKRINIYLQNFFSVGWPHHSSFSAPNSVAIVRRGPPNGGVGYAGRMWEK